MRLHPARLWHLDGDPAKDDVYQYVRLVLLHKLAHGKAGICPVAAGNGLILPRDRKWDLQQFGESDRRLPAGDRMGAVVTFHGCGFSWAR
jgi:hypothetical protein